ncbi:MAG: hypothetical protein UH850_02095 [Paludibacteraceae bacterium]|nr:hypothetical protein [Paludibacteraceae bacterium]
MKMPTKYIFTLIICMFVASVQAKGENAWKKDGLKGKVKEMRAYYKDYGDTLGKIGKEDFKWSRKYDKKGNCIEYLNQGVCKYNLTKTRIKSSKFGDWNTKYKYAGNKLHKEIISRDREAFETIEYKYDNKELLIEKNTYNSLDELTDKYIYEYDNNGNKIKEEYYSRDILSHVYNYKYNEKGICIEEIYTDGILDSKTEYKYDECGNLIEETRIRLTTTIFDDPNENGNIVYYECIYTPNGKLSKAYKSKFNLFTGEEFEEHVVVEDKKNIKKVDLTPEKNIYKYDEKGNMTEIIFYDQSGTYKGVRHQKYDEIGNIIEIRTDGSINRFHKGGYSNFVEINFEYEYYK